MNKSCLVYSVEVTTETAPALPNSSRGILLEVADLVTCFESVHGVRVTLGCLPSYPETERCVMPVAIR